MINRREVLQAGLIMAIAGAAGFAAIESPRVMTVRGPVVAEDMGLTLPHEHILVDFIGAERVSAV